jgi:hydrogenase-4 component F
MYQALIGAMSLALVANDMGLLWVGLEIATLVTVMMVGIYRTPAAIEAAWKYFILGSVGIALAFFGTILLYLAGQGALGDGLPALAWNRLHQASASLDPALLSLSFVFFVVGYGTKIGLVPLHAWLPDAHAEGPTPISAVLSGLLLNVALYALLRCKMILAANLQTLQTAPILMSMGLASVLFAALMLYRRHDIKRFFAYSSIEQMGLITFAFGIGGPLANLAGLLQMTMHSLTKSGIFFAVGHVVQAKGSQQFQDVRGLSMSHPVLAWGLALGVLAIAGMPPFGIFMSEFLLVTTTFARQPLLALLLVSGVLVAFAALLLRLQQMLLGEPSGVNRPIEASTLPLFAHLALVLIGGLYLPAPLLHWFRQVALLLG